MTADPSGAPVAGVAVPPPDAAPVAAGDEGRPGVIATLAAPLAHAGGVRDDPRTGEPRRPWPVRIAAGLSFAAVAVMAVAVLLVYWDAVPRENFTRASWLMGQFATEPGSLGRVLLAVAVTVITLVAAVPMAITGYYAWAGYRWSRISGIVAALLSFAALTLNVWAWAAIPLAVAAGAAMWLPSVSAFFAAWHARRHPLESFAPPTTDVFYGPLPRYR